MATSTATKNATPANSQLYIDILESLAMCKALHLAHESAIAALERLEVSILGIENEIDCMTESASIAVKPQATKRTRVTITRTQF